MINLPSRFRVVAASAALAAAAILLNATAAQAQSPDLTGAGATFPYPIYSKWFAEYAEKTGVKINYQSIGSGGGIRQLTDGTVDFGASDAPMSDEEMAKLKTPVLHVPTVLGGVVITYNVPEIKGTIKLTGDVIAQIFMGTVTKWNAPAIAQLNPGVALPDKDILVVHRSDGSGTTYIFSDYLTSVSPTWKAGPGKGKELQWPVGIGGKGNEGIAGQVKQTPYSIGYVELAYARQNKLPMATLKNAAGNFVMPSIETVTNAASGMRVPLTADFRVSLVNPSGSNAYPISSFTYLLVPRTMTNPAKEKELVKFVKWAIHDGEKEAPDLDYAPLPKNVVDVLDAQLGKLGS